jgi:ABC-type oligopeptide transport system substrate-binding subunit
MKQKNFLKYFTVLLFSSIVFLAGCEKKTEDTEKPVGDTLRPDTTQPDTTKADTTKGDTTLSNIQGIWRGTLTERSTTFNISEFSDNKIKGTISIQSRGVITKQVEGTFVPETRTVRLSDITRSRDMGRYSGKLSEDGTTLSGTFTTNADGRTSSFNFKKAK